LSTDSEQYAEIGRQYGAEIPFLRPAELASDTALDFDVFEHLLKVLKDTEGYEADVVVQLRPTYPIRDVADIDAMIEQLLQNPALDSVRSISPAKEIPFKMWTMATDGSLTPIYKENPECYNMPRQELPMAYYQNACIDVFRGSTILEKHSMTGTDIAGYVMLHNFDIDTEAEMVIAQQVLEIRQGMKRFVVDIDGVLAITKDTSDYSKSVPNQPIIDQINRFYDYGNEIVLFTARGFTTGVDWSEVTRSQMQAWGVKYHELRFGKPHADFYLDDHALTLEGLTALSKA
jgi:CMP-N-acetylneuraminic acid synthetase